MDIEPRRFKSETVYMISASFVALVALVVSVWQGYETRKHNRLSVKPYLTFEKNSTSHQKNDTTIKAYKLVLKNSGTGPVIVKSFELYLGNQKIIEDIDFSLWQNIINQTEAADIIIFQSSTFDSGDVIESGFNRSLIKMTFAENILKKIKLKIVYQSIYEEEFSVETMLLN